MKEVGKNYARKKTFHFGRCSLIDSDGQRWYISIFGYYYLTQGGVRKRVNHRWIVSARESHLGEHSAGCTWVTLGSTSDKGFTQMKSNWVDWSSDVWKAHYTRSGFFEDIGESPVDVKCKTGEIGFKTESILCCLNTECRRCMNSLMIFMIIW